jgi:hypothetical protein
MTNVWFVTLVSVRCPYFLCASSHSVRVLHNEILRAPLIALFARLITTAAARPLASALAAHLARLLFPH